MMNANQDPNPRNALVRLLIVLAITIGFSIYSYGWTVTNIDLERPQDEQRQATVTRALRELLSPLIFVQDRVSTDLTAYFRVGCIEGETLDQLPEQPFDATITLSTDCGDFDDEIEVEVTGLEPLLSGAVRWQPPEEGASTRPRTILETGREDFTVASDGRFIGTVQVPRIRGSEGEIAEVIVRILQPVGNVRFSENTNRVASSMLETIFMALVATTVAIPIAVMLSFFAAKNLMKDIHLSLGSLLLSLIGFMIGLVLGGWLLADVVRFGVESGVEAGTVRFFAIFLIVGVFFYASANFTRYLARMEATDNAKNAPIIQMTRLIWAVIIAFFIAYFVGALAGLGTLGSGQINNLGDAIIPSDTTDLNIAGQIINAILSLIGGAINAIANLLSVLSELLIIGASLVGALIGAFIVPGIINGLLAGPLRRTPVGIGHVLGGIMGAIGGMILLGVLGAIGMWAALFTLLTPFIGGLIGGQIPVLIYNHTFSKRIVKSVYAANRLDKMYRFILFWLGAVPVAIYIFSDLNLPRSIINGILPSEATGTILGITLPLYVIDTMIYGLVLGGIAGALAGTHGSFPIGPMMYNTSRTILNIIRSIEPLIMGLVFVIWVGVGPFAGVLALTLHSIASLGKLYSEQVENIDPGPLEALDSTGANRLQTIVYAVVPQIVPPYIAFTMYRWDINVRMSTIIGFVGGGGIGLLLQQEINLLAYRSAGVAVLAIAIVVSILDYASAYIRSRVM